VPTTKNVLDEKGPNFPVYSGGRGAFLSFELEKRTTWKRTGAPSGTIVSMTNLLCGQNSTRDKPSFPRGKDGEIETPIQRGERKEKKKRPFRPALKGNRLNAFSRG